VHQRISGGNNLFKKLLQEEIKVMNGQIDFIKTNQTLLASFLAGDRSILADNARSLFERMRSTYRITHFYFHETDKTCFLRVHSPNRHGDIIDRFTLERTVSTGKPHHGIELGPFGTFMLRVVYPWMVDDKLEGYIELGMEIEHITQFIKQVEDLDLFLLIEKKFLDRKKWETGLKILSRKGNWGLFEDFVIIDQTMEGSVDLNQKLILHKNQNNHDFIFSYKFTNRHYKGKFNDLIDVGGRNVGEIVSLVDITAQRTGLVKETLIIAGIFFVTGGGLFLLFNTYIGEIQNRLITSKAQLLSEITERKQIEKALKNNQSFLNNIIDQSPFATWISDEKGTIIKCNIALTKLLNITDEQLIGKYNVFEDAIAIEQGIIPKIRTVFENGKTANFSVEWDANELGYKDTNKVHIEGTMFPIHDDKGNLTNVVNNWVDVTKRKQAEKGKIQ
ncbi:MAG: PAS domain S-box protein, partial [Bacteroidetes bacterium]|nr:PAS domain S-box protein [Bacteroidota bacterium]